MKSHFTFRNMKESEAIKKYAVNVFNMKLEKQEMDTIWADMIFSTFQDEMVFRCYIYTHDGKSYYARHTGDNICDAIDKTADKLVAQVHRERGSRSIWWEDYPRVDSEARDWSSDSWSNNMNENRNSDPSNSDHKYDI